MSVHEGAREDNKFTLPIRAEEMAKHTLCVTKNQNLFLPEYQKEIVDQINHSAVEAYLLIRDANDISVEVDKVVIRKRLEDRLDLQENAIRHLKRVLNLIQLARRVYHLKGQKVRYWSALVAEVRDRTVGWMREDMRRYG